MNSSLIAGLVFLAVGTVNGAAQEPSIVESRGIEFPGPLLEHPSLALVDDGFGSTEQPGMSSSDGNYLLWGIGIGLVGGIAWGAVAMSSTDAYVGPPALEARRGIRLDGLLLEEVRTLPASRAGAGDERVLVCESLARSRETAARARILQNPGRVQYFGPAA